MLKRIHIGVLAKTGGLLSVLLLVVFSGLIMLNYWNISSFFEIERAESLKHQQVLFKRYYQDVYGRLSLLTRTFELSENATSSTALDLKQQLHNELKLPVQVALLTDAQGNLVEASDGGQWQHILTWFQQSENQQKNWLLDCHKRCHLYFKIDSERPGKKLNIIYGIGAIALFNGNQSGNTHQHFLIGVPATNQVALLYSSSPISPKLGAMLNKITAKELASGLHELVSDQHVYELSSFKVDNSTSQMPVYYVQLYPIEGLIQHFRQANRNNLLFGIGSLLLCLFLLNLLLKGPLSRIRRLTSGLPMLAGSNHRQFRQNISQHRQHLLMDETDELAEVAVQLSYQLEDLENQLHSRADELEWIAGHDYLTHLANRRYFEKLLKQALTKHDGCLLSIDLDNFKYVNDISGHGCGDEMLRQVAQMLQNYLPQSAILARIGGDQFGAFIPELDLSIAEAMAERISQLIAEISIPGFNTIHSASVSIGIVAAPEHGNSFYELMSRVDICLFQAKKEGKHCIVVYQSNELSNEIVQNHYWLDLAQHAIERQQMRLYYQPIQDNHDGVTRHHEVLLRIVAEDGELVSPYDFILAAEKNGYITHIDLWVIVEALEQLTYNLKHQINDKIAINLSARSFCSRPVINRIINEFAARNIPGEMVIFEITETAALPNIEQAKAHILLLKKMGCSIALDDFGVGYSSFHSLRELPLDYIKIDGSFVRDILDNEKNRYFVQALSTIAADMGYLTIAEYVESGELAELLRDLGIDFIQGYHVGKPRPAEQVWNTQRTTQVLSLSSEPELD